MSDVVITGTGLVTALGRGPDRVLAAMDRGVSGFGNGNRPERRGTGTPLPWPIAALRPDDIRWPDGGSWVNIRKYANAAAHASVAAARLALAGTAPASDGDPGEEDPREEDLGDGDPRGGVVVAVGCSGTDELEDVMPRLAALAETDPRSLPRFLYDEVPDYSYLRSIPSQIGQFVAMAAGFRGSNASVYGEAGAGGLGALSVATRLLRCGELDRVLVVGVAPPMSREALVAVDRAEALGTEAIAGRGPFDLGRAGTLIGEGAAAILLERADARPSRPARQLVRLARCEVLCAPTGPQALDATVDMVLAPAMRPVGFWWAHGAGSITTDMDECRIVATRLAAPTTSSKGTIGNAFECSGLIDTVLAVAALRRERIPPVGLLRKPDPVLGDVDVVHDAPRPLPGVRSALVTALGHGGVAAAGAALIEREGGG